MNLGAQLTEIARGRPSALALIDERSGRKLTFAQLETEVAAAAGWLAGRGLRRGDAVLVFVPMSADLYVALLAMFRLGVVALFLDPSAGLEHLERSCDRWPPKALLAIPKAHLLRLRSAVLRRIPLKFSVGSWVPGAQRWLAGARPGISESNVEPDDPALVTFTSGSTGVPKAAVRTHRFLLAQHRALEPNIALVPGEVDLATLPVFTLANLASGVTTIIPDVDLRKPGAVDGARVLAQIRRRHVTRITASPAFFERLAGHCEASGSQLRGVTKIYTGGAPVFQRLLVRLTSIAPEAEVVAVYGSTEAEPIAHVHAAGITPDDFAAMQRGRGLLAGDIVPEVRLAVLVDRWGQPRPAMTQAAFEQDRVAVAQVGEIVVTGEHVLKGYLGGLGDEETKFRVDGTVWHRTGDAGLIDETGRLWLLGRCAARIEDARGRLYPFAVEAAVLTIPEVRRAAAVSHGGQRVLVIECDGTPAGLRRRILQATAAASIEAVYRLDRIPVDARHNAKVNYPELARRLSSAERLADTGKN